jgi:hypothetical protein
MRRYYFNYAMEERRALDTGKMFLITEGKQEAQRNTEIKKTANFFARAKKLESSFFALAKNEKLKTLCLCDLCVNIKKSFQCPVPCADGWFK